MVFFLHEVWAWFIVLRNVSNKLFELLIASRVFLFYDIYRTTNEIVHQFEMFFFEVFKFVFKYLLYAIFSQGFGLADEIVATKELFLIYWCRSIFMRMMMFLLIVAIVFELN